MRAIINGWETAEILRAAQRSRDKRDGGRRFVRVAERTLDPELVRAVEHASGIAIAEHLEAVFRAWDGQRPDALTVALRERVGTLGVPLVIEPLRRDELDEEDEHGDDGGDWADTGEHPHVRKLRGRGTAMLDAATLAPRAKTPAMYEAVEDLAWLGPHHFAAASSRGEVNLYELASMRLLRPIAPPELDYGQLGGITATPDGSHLFLAVGPKLTCFSIQSGQPVWSIVRSTHDSEAGPIALAPEASWLAMGTREGLSFFEARTGRSGPTFPWTCAESVSWPGQEYNQWKPRPVFAPDSSHVLVNDRVGNLVRVDAQRLACAQAAPRQQGLAWITQLRLFPRGERMLVVGTEHRVGLAARAVHRARPRARRRSSPGQRLRPPLRPRGRRRRLRRRRLRPVIRSQATIAAPEGERRTLASSHRQSAKTSR